MSYALAFNKLCPDAQWSCSGSMDDYNNFIWLDNRPQPSQADCDAVMAEAVAEKDRAVAQVNRQAAYQAEADPLYFGFQRGENTEQDWLDKVAEIRARYPYPA
jgi:hypothetical protein